jgi:hypothetical protein
VKSPPCWSGPSAGRRKSPPRWSGPSAGPRKPLGAVTRGTTNPNRLRRVDSWLAATLGPALRAAAEPVVVDLGYGASPVTAVELRSRLARVRADVRVVGLEIDPVRVAQARYAAQPPYLTFARGGFELAGLRPVAVRAMNVLRQYDLAEVDAAWAAMASRLTPDGAVVEGTCDEVGRLASWVRIGPAGPVSLTLAARLSTLDSPGTFAERLPKALIHHNVPGQRVHEFLRGLDDAWRAAAPYSTFGARQRWVRAVSMLAQTWPVLDRPNRWRLGEVTVAWDAVSAR